MTGSSLRQSQGYLLQHDAGIRVSHFHRGLKNEFVVVDFRPGRFRASRHGRHLWYNDKATNVFGQRDLPAARPDDCGACHESTVDVQPKREAWHVRHGWICTFGEGAAPEILPGVLNCRAAKPSSSPPQLEAGEGREKWTLSGALQPSIS